MKLFKTIKQIISGQPLAINSLVVFIGSMGANVASYLYHLVMGRMMGPVKYGELSSLLSLLYIFNVPIIVGQIVIVKFASSIKAQGEPGQAKYLFFSITKYFILFCLGLLPIVLLIAPAVSEFLHLANSQLFVLLYILLCIALISIVPLSILQAYQLFVWFSIFTAGNIFLKLIISIPHKL